MIQAIINLLTAFARRLIGHFRTLILGAGLACVGFFVLDSYEQFNAYFNYATANAKVLKLEWGCIDAGADRKLLHPVEVCPARGDGGKMESKPYVTFEFIGLGGEIHQLVRLVGEVGLSRKTYTGEKFKLLYDPEEPQLVKAVLGNQYYSFTLPIGFIGLMLLSWHFMSRRVLSQFRM
jgi:hypothetical protein